MLIDIQLGKQKKVSKVREKAVFLETEILEKYSDLEYLKYMIAFHAAPTIMGKKAASLVVFRNGKRKMKDIWLANMESCLRLFAVSVYTICQHSESIHLLFYQGELLENCLKSDDNRTYLEQFGYASTHDLEKDLQRLSIRFQTGCPHEVGIFLDYPLYDVIAFTNCRHQDCLVTGYWRVYQGKEQAIKRFREFDRVKEYLLGWLIHSGYTNLPLKNLISTC